MANVNERIRMFSLCLTPNEAKVAAYCQNNPAEVIDHSITDIAQCTGVSVASVSRLASRLGFRDWKEMRLSFARITPEATEGGDVPNASPSTNDDSFVHGLFEGQINSIRQTLNILNMDKLVAVAGHLLSAPRILFFGEGGSGCMAHDEALRYAKLDLPSEAYSEGVLMTRHAARLTDGCVAVGFSSSGRSIVTSTALRIARAKGAMAVGVSNCRNTPVEEHAEHFFCAALPCMDCFAELPSSQVTSKMIMDSLYALTIRKGMAIGKVYDFSPDVDELHKYSSKQCRTRNPHCCSTKDNDRHEQT